MVGCGAVQWLCGQVEDGTRCRAAIEWEIYLRHLPYFVPPKRLMPANDNALGNSQLSHASDTIDDADFVSPSYLGLPPRGL